MRRLLLLGLLVAVGCSAKQSKKKKTTTRQIESAHGLKSAAEFVSIEGDEARAQALFGEMAKVLQHPRCLNCHPAGDTPRQGEAMKPHQPLVVRGEDNHGVPGMRCASCHGDSNVGNVPGHPHWHLAPIEMAWVGKSATEICQQIKDPERNGGKTMDELIEHMAEDPLVGWGWDPPDHLEPAPGNQALLGDLTRAWVDAGAHCP